MYSLVLIVNEKTPNLSIYLLSLVCIGVYVFSMAKILNPSLHPLPILPFILIGIVFIFTIFLHRTNSTKVKILLWIGTISYFISNLVHLPFEPILNLFLDLLIFTIFFLALTFSLEFSTSSLNMPDEPPVQKSPSFLSAYSDHFSYVSKHVLFDYIHLTKPRLMWLLCLVAFAGMAVSARSSLSFNTIVLTLLGGILAIGASGTFNHIFEADLDKNMSRTANRPLATQKISKSNAWIFGITLATASTLIFLTLNLFAALLALSAILYYSVIYTLFLKPNTAQNTVIGGIAGSFPVIIGSVAATATITTDAILLAILIFFWTPAHFYNLALTYKKDFEQSGLPMFPVVHGDAKTRKHILFYFGATLISALLFFFVSGLSLLFFSVNSIFFIVFLWTIILSHYQPSRLTSMRAFYASNLYLGALLISIILEILL